MTMVRIAVVPVVSVMTIVMLPTLIVGAPCAGAGRQDDARRAGRVIDLLSKSEKEFLDAVESVSDGPVDLQGRTGPMVHRRSGGASRPRGGRPVSRRRRGASPLPPTTSGRRRSARPIC